MSTTMSAASARELTGLATALRIERRKLLTTRGWWMLGILAIAVGALITVLTVAGASESEHTPIDVFTGALTGGVQTSYMVTAMVGIIAVAGEYRHRTVTPSFLAVPHRGTMIGAKLLVLLAYGAAVGLLVMIVCSLIAAPGLESRGLLNGSLDASALARGVIGGAVAIAIVTGIGVALAALVHNQMAAIAGLLIYLFAIEPAVNRLEATRDIYPYLPGGAVQALTFSGNTAFGSPTGATLLSPWVGGLLLALYAAAIIVVAVLTTIRRDIT